MANKTWIYNAYLAQNAWDKVEIQNSKITTEEKPVVKQKNPETTEEKPQIQQIQRIAGVFPNYGGVMKIQCFYIYKYDKGENIKKSPVAEMINYENLHKAEGILLAIVLELVNK